MASEAGKVAGSGDLTLNKQIFHEKQKIILFALVIIIGLGLFAVAGTGLGAHGHQCGWWQAHVVSQLDGVKMMATGFSLGGVFLIVGGLGVGEAHFQQLSLNKIDQKIGAWQASNLTKKQAALKGTNGSIFVKSMLFGAEEWETCFGYKMKKGSFPPLPLTHYDPSSEIPSLIPKIDLREFLARLEALEIPLFKGILAEALIQPYLSSSASEAHWIIWKKEGLDTDCDIEDTRYSNVSITKALICLCIEHLMDNNLAKDSEKDPTKIYRSASQHTQDGKRYFLGVDLSSNSLKVCSGHNTEFKKLAVGRT